MVYLSLNSGALVESTHCEKNQVSLSPRIFSHTWRKSSTVADFMEYCCANVRMAVLNLESPRTKRSMCRIIAPLSVTTDWNSGENVSSEPTLLRGTVW